ncbi:peptidoglycan O-acetyltransferase [Sporosarcina sp. NCCP-2716]|uniref:MBOAT family O-acyltransferase n=1 Tax=Sporosarcina sp. NCCP-2716 TaxID=2943679 RepID=UPI00203E2D09|nr:MBOAT family protein [Sporosarcina sp. NCCP-2716]GKV69299.1 peptidoglycan O-acetyltransferase [Sporosarcina sp. NCCP-2716]
MIFNSFEFIFLFLPIVWAGFFLIGKAAPPFAKTWLLLASLFFYAYWNPAYLPLIVGSMIVNYIIGVFLGRNKWLPTRKLILTVGILFNVALLGYFKYRDFFAENMNLLFGTDIELIQVLLPLAISFYTFQQIAYLVDSYRLETNEYNFLNYGLFVSFFPQLIAGPIVHHGDMMPQFSDRKTYRVNYENIAKGLVIFAVGLFKKVAIADTFAAYANSGYGSVDTLTMISGWVTSLSYTLQLYFDFSGYSDMAIGLALFFNIRLPINFNSPYKALDIQDFWRRWHITLSGFLTKYIYIPLGGSRKGVPRTYVNIFIIFLISGFWHGAGWTFVIWGILHGLASVIARIWKRSGGRLPKLWAWAVTFLFVHFAFVIFRAPDMTVAMQVFKAMFGFEGLHLTGVFSVFNVSLGTLAFYLAIGLGIALFAKNSVQIMETEKRTPLLTVFVIMLLYYSAMQLQRVSEFLYFNF